MKFYTYTEQEQKIRKWWLYYLIFSASVGALSSLSNMFISLYSQSTEAPPVSILDWFFSLLIPLAINWAIYLWTYKKPGTKLLTFLLGFQIAVLVGGFFSEEVAKAMNEYYVAPFVAQPWYKVVWYGMVNVFYLFGNYLIFKMRQINLYVKNEGVLTSDEYIKAVNAMKEATSLQELEQRLVEAIEDKPEFFAKRLRTFFEKRACDLTSAPQH